jgi:exosortase
MCRSGPAWFYQCLWGAPFTVLWFGLIRQLSGEWTLNPQYAYGWAVPALCVFLLYRDLRFGVSASAIASPPGKWSKRGLLFCAILISLAYGLTRLIQEANPDWRLVSWTMALEVIALTILVWRLALLRKLPLFPILFFLIAVPWPTLIETPTIRGLTTTIAACTAEILGWLGIPAVVRGNLIEVSSGMIGIEEACSGIRSLQASVMVALFFGQVYTLRRASRFLCLGAAVVLALLFNLARTLLLTLLAATKGPGSVSGWHDLAGVPILAMCFMAVCLVAKCLRQDTYNDRPSFEPTRPKPLLQLFSTDYARRGAIVPVLLLIWIVMVEVGTSAWYTSRERRLPAAITWRIVRPRDQAQFRELSFSPSSRRILRFDDAINATWLDEQGLQWQAIFLQWNRGGAAVRLARNHTPADCLPASGLALTAASSQHTVSVCGLALPFRSYTAQSQRGLVRVFYCLWEDRCKRREFDAENLTYRQRLSAVLAGQRNSGQRSLELALWGAPTQPQAEAALRALLYRIIEVDH